MAPDDKVVGFPNPHEERQQRALAEAERLANLSAPDREATDEPARRNGLWRKNIRLATRLCDERR
jgi:hypothetical protein